MSEHRQRSDEMSADKTASSQNGASHISPSAFTSHVRQNNLSPIFVQQGVFRFDDLGTANASASVSAEVHLDRETLPIRDRSPSSHRSSRKVKAAQPCGKQGSRFLISRVSTGFGPAEEEVTRVSRRNLQPLLSLTQLPLASIRGRLRAETCFYSLLFTLLTKRYLFTLRSLPSP